MGADDYVTKPFSMNELVARIRVALRHRLAQQGERPVFRVGDLSVDLVRRIVRIRGEEVKLSPKEYEILRLLIQHAGRVLTHRFILKEVWGEVGGYPVFAGLYPLASPKDRRRLRPAPLYPNGDWRRISDD